MRPLLASALALASVALVPAAAAQPSLDLRVQVPEGPLTPIQPLQGAYEVELFVPEGVEGNVTLHLQGPWSDAGHLVDAWFDPGWIEIPAPAAGRHVLAGALWLRASPEAPAFLPANLSLTADASNDTWYGSGTLARAATLVPLSVDWAPGLDARLEASHVRIPPEGGAAMALLEVVNSGNAAQTVAPSVLLAPEGCATSVGGTPLTLAPHERAPLHARLDCAPGWRGGQLVVSFVPRLAADPAREGRAVEAMWDVQNTTMPLPYPQPRQYGEEDRSGQRQAPFGGAFGTVLSLGVASAVARAHRGVQGAPPPGASRAKPGHAGTRSSGSEVDRAWDARHGVDARDA